MVNWVSDIRIHREFDVKAVHWDTVEERLISRFNFDAKRARQLVKRFLELFLTPLEPSRHNNSALSPDNNCILAALCEAHGADTVTLTHHARIARALFSVGYEIKVHFTPVLKHFGSEESVAKSEIKEQNFTIFGRKIKLNSARQAALWRLLLIILATALIVPFIGCFVYGLAVFMVFLEQPRAVTLSALNDGAIGLGLLCFLVGFAGLFGRAVSNSARKIHEVIQNRR